MMITILIVKKIETFNMYNTNVNIMFYVCHKSLLVSIRKVLVFIMLTFS